MSSSVPLNSDRLPLRGPGGCLSWAMSGPVHRPTRLRAMSDPAVGPIRPALRKPCAADWAPRPRHRPCCPAHSDAERDLLVSACSDDASIRVWDHHTGQEVLRLVTGAPVTSFVVLPASSANRTTAPAVIVGSPTGTAAVTVHLQPPGGTMREDA